MLYEIKLQLKPKQKQEIIDKFGLVFVKEYRDVDNFIKVDSENKEYEKVKEIDNIFKYYKIYFDGEIFVINGRVISDLFEIKKLKDLPLVKKIVRRKEVFSWPDMKIETAFDYLEEFDEILFFEVYDNNRKRVIISKKDLILSGYNNFFTKAYVELKKYKKCCGK